MNGFGKAKLLAVLALAGVAALGFRAGSGQLPEKAMPAKAGEGGGRADAPKVAAGLAKAIALTGRVLDPDGRPLPGARLLVAGVGDAPVEAGVSGRDGRFAVSVPAANPPPHLVARADGFGVDFVVVKPFGAREVELRLVKDRAIHGRVLDTQGKPRAGITVGIQALTVYTDDAWQALKKGTFFSRTQQNAVRKVFNRAGTGATLLPVTTDADGRFTLRGAGERVVILAIEGGGLAQFDYLVANCDGFDPKPYNDAIRWTLQPGAEEIAAGVLLHAPDQDIVAEPEMPIRGTVTAADMGKGRPGTVIRLHRPFRYPLSPPLQATTDSAGRYEFHGARKAKTYTLLVQNDAESGYLARMAQVADNPGYTPVTADFRVARGVTVKGKVVDASTGKGLPGRVGVDALTGNPFAKDYTPFNAVNYPLLANTADDGSFRLVTIPGPVILVGGPDGERLADGADALHRYEQRVSDSQFPQYFPANQRGPIPEESYLSSHGRAQLPSIWCKVLEIEPGAAVVEQDVRLEPATGLPLQLRDAEGKPLTGVLVGGTSPRGRWSPCVCKTDVCNVYELETDSPRPLVFYDRVRKLAATLILKADEPPPLTVTLRPMGAVKGRLVREDGSPLAGIAVGLNYRDRPAYMMGDLFRHVQTDADGAFTIDGILDGMPFQLAHSRNQKSLTLAGNLGAMTAESGRTKDLGTLTAKTDDGGVP
jgi:hypothetical protein